MFRIVVLTNPARSDLEARACDKAKHLLELFNVHHRIVDGFVHPEMCKQLLQVSGAVPVCPQFYLEDDDTNEVCVLGDLCMIEQMLEQGVLPGQRDPSDVYCDERPRPLQSLYDEDRILPCIKRSQSMLATCSCDEVVTRPCTRTAQSMKPLLVRDTSFGTNDTKSWYTIQLSDDSDSSSESDVSDDADATENSCTELVLLEDEPYVNHEIKPERSPAAAKVHRPISSTGYIEPSFSPFLSKKSADETEAEIWSMIQQDSPFNSREEGACSSDFPERFVTPAHSFNLPLEQAVANEPMAPKITRPKLQLDFSAFMQNGGSFRQKLVRGHSLLQSNPASRTSSFCSQDGSFPMAPCIKFATMEPPPFDAPGDEPSRNFVTPNHSFVARGPGLMQGCGGIEPNMAPQTTRNVISIGDFERCALPGADSFRRQIVRGNSLLASNSSFRRSVSRDSSSFCRSIARGVSRYATDDSLAPLKEEVKLDKNKDRAIKKTVKIVMSDDDEDQADAPLKPALFGLIRKSSIMRPVADTSKAVEGSSSHHTKTTVDISSSDENSEGASFGDSCNNEDDSSVSGDCNDEGSQSSTEFEEQDDDLALRDSMSSLKDRSLSFVSTASTQSWSLYESVS